MTGPKPDPRDVETRPISVAELLAKNGNIGSPPVTGRRRRRRGNADAVTVAELTGEIPIIRVDDEAPAEPDAPASGPLPIGPEPGLIDDDRPATGPRPVASRAAEPRPAEPRPAEPRWPKSPQQPARGNGPQQSAYPRPMRRSEPPVAEKTVRPAAEIARPAADTGRSAAIRLTGSGAERMRPDPVDTYTDIELDVMETDVRDADLPVTDSAYVRSYLNPAGADRSVRPGLRTGRDSAADLADEDDFVESDEVSEGREAEAADEYVGPPGMVGGALVVLQSILAVAFGGGLFIAFDQLWRWNSIVALVLTVLVTLGLVAAVQAVRKTVDIASTLIAVAVGLLVTLGPLALHAN
ncbi:hypothetical protein [[Mycobacterium] nativiensis]|uniref:Transmembrane protein n=1 Tax=[Mycobacterium] nativiensis TaxID=2855503 RepID=A0ABU5XXG7_9MYCO|nr:hypothetical protein [Mycolicibacter sp. MYC340]MEB3032482.1 hypothetical protein [Mycolicibacter sp. MYC340]